MPRHPDAIEVGRDWNLKRFRNPDRTNTFEFHAGSIHYRDTPAGPWLDKRPGVRAGAGTNEWISDASDVVMRTFQTGTGGARRWPVEFYEKLTGNGIRFILANQPSTTPGSDTLTFAGGWTYTHGPAGGKILGPSVNAAQGPQSHTFNYELMGAAPELVENPDGSISCGNVFRMPAPHLLGADDFPYAYGSWDVDPVARSITFAYNDTDLPASAYPYRVDPSTSFLVSLGGNDQRVEKFASAYTTADFTAASLTRATSESSVYTRRGLSASLYRVANGLIWFDTQQLVDTDFVTAAELRLWIAGSQGTNTDGLSHGYENYQWSGSSAADWELQSNINTTPLYAMTGIPLNAYKVYTINNAASVIRKTTGTGFRGHVSGGQPSVDNYVRFSSFEAGGDPMLVVDTFEQQLFADQLVGTQNLAGTLASTWLTADLS